MLYVLRAILVVVMLCWAAGSMAVVFGRMTIALFVSRIVPYRAPPRKSCRGPHPLVVVVGVPIQLPLDGMVVYGLGFGGDEGQGSKRAPPTLANRATWVSEPSCRSVALSNTRLAVYYNNLYFNIMFVLVVFKYIKYSL